MPNQNIPLTKTPTPAVIPFSVTSPYKITPVKRTNPEKSKVKCLKTAEIPKIAQAELDSNVKLSNFSGITMTPSMSKRPSIPTELLQPSFPTSKSTSRLVLALRMVVPNYSAFYETLIIQHGVTGQLPRALAQANR